MRLASIFLRGMATILWIILDYSDSAALTRYDKKYCLLSVPLRRFYKNWEFQERKDAERAFMCFGKPRSFKRQFINSDMAKTLIPSKVRDVWVRMLADGMSSTEKVQPDPHVVYDQYNRHIWGAFLIMHNKIPKVMARTQQVGLKESFFNPIRNTLGCEIGKDMCHTIAKVLGGSDNDANLEVCGHEENTDYWILEEQFQSFLTNLADHPVINMYGDYWVEMSPEFATGGIRTIKGYYKNVYDPYVPHEDNTWREKQLILEYATEDGLRAYQMYRIYNDQSKLCKIEKKNQKNHDRTSPGYRRYQSMVGTDPPHILIPLDMTLEELATEIHTQHPEISYDKFLAPAVRNKDNTYNLTVLFDSKDSNLGQSGRYEITKLRTVNKNGERKFDGSRNILVNNQKERGWAIGDAKGHVLFAWMWGSNYDENMFGFSKTMNKAIGDKFETPLRSNMKKLIDKHSKGSSKTTIESTIYYPKCQMQTEDVQNSRQCELYPRRYLGIIYGFRFTFGDGTKKEFVVKIDNPLTDLHDRFVENDHLWNDQVEDGCLEFIKDGDHEIFEESGKQHGYKMPRDKFDTKSKIRFYSPIDLFPGTAIPSIINHMSIYNDMAMSMWRERSCPFAACKYTLSNDERDRDFDAHIRTHRNAVTDLHNWRMANNPYYRDYKKVPPSQSPSTPKPRPSDYVLSEAAKKYMCKQRQPKNNGDNGDNDYNDME